jgi:lipopolysaccharide export system permease protein
MIPILWRYLLSSYFKIFSLSIASFISILLVSRFKDIARFTALSGSWLQTSLFSLYQIPLILPLAIPISSLIASLLLFQRLSKSYELTAWRAAGLSLPALLSPLIYASFFLGLANFSFCANIAPYCRRETKTLLYLETTSNPLLLLQRQNLIRIKNTYLNMNVKEEGKLAEDLLFIAHNRSNKRLTLLSAKEIEVCEDKLLGYDVAIVSHLPSHEPLSFDSLVIENQASLSTAGPLLSSTLKKNRPHLDMSALNLKMLNIKKLEKGKQALSAHVEILRRISLALAVFSFTLLGVAF